MEASAAAREEAVKTWNGEGSHLIPDANEQVYAGHQAGESYSEMVETHHEMLLQGNLPSEMD